MGGSRRAAQVFILTGAHDDHTEDIQSELAALPLHLRAEVLDFVRFVKQRRGLLAAPAPVASALDKGDSAFFLALEAAGFVGAIESDEQLSTTYKNRLDFSGQSEARP